MNFFKVGSAVLIVALALVLNAQHFVSYEPIAKFSSPSISKVYTDKKANNLDEAIKMALKITTNQLTFKLKSSGNSDVNYLVKSGQAHCVGYANFYNAMLKSILINSNIKDCKIYRVRATVIFAGIDLTSISDDPSFKDHDISMVIDYKNNVKYLIDPSLSEVMGSIIQQSSVLE
jgi:hypothetical protein